MNLHQEIMNIPCDKIKLNDVKTYSTSVIMAYKEGHRDARHAAAELSLKAEARIEELEDVIKAFLDWTTNEHGNLSLLDDVALWKRAEEVLKR